MYQGHQFLARYGEMRNAHKPSVHQLKLLSLHNLYRTKLESCAPTIFVLICTSPLYSSSIQNMCFSNPHFFSNSSPIRFLHPSLSSPLYLPAFSFITPLKSII